jgi:hypothetical protein
LPADWSGGDGSRLGARGGANRVAILRFGLAHMSSIKKIWKKIKKPSQSKVCPTLAK